MSIFHYNAEQWLHTSPQEAWDFFSSPGNLPLITPPELRFKILTAGQEEIFAGMLINYTVSPLFTIPLHWRTEICSVRKPFVFVDRQVKGPYRLWEHTHTFIEKEKGILMKDDVRYQLPLGPVGALMHTLLVREKIVNIFAYRRKVLSQLFNSHGNNS